MSNKLADTIRSELIGDAAKLLQFAELHDKITSEYLDKADLVTHLVELSDKDLARVPCLLGSGIVVGEA